MTRDALGVAVDRLQQHSAAADEPAAGKSKVPQFGVERIRRGRWEFASLIRHGRGEYGSDYTAADPACCPEAGDLPAHSGSDINTVNAGTYVGKDRSSMFSRG